MTLHEFTLSYRDSNDTVTPYVLRYWVDPMTENRVRTWYISFATASADGSPNPDALDLLDKYAARMYPDLPSCPR